MTHRSGHHLLLAAISLGAAALALATGCRAKAPSEGFTAEIFSDGKPHGRVAAQGDALRLEMQGARRSSIAIARYDRKVLWVLAPTAGLYRELPLATWEDRYPNFLRPGLRFEREPVGRSDVDGVAAYAWKVRVPRDGGIILAVGKDRDQIEAIAREDPFCARGLADFRIIEFRASQKADDIQQRIAATFR